uniref:Uncharacterized protein n=2 Tax=Rhinopithecus TaxID=542827 RepID=A0A2K6LWI6_RHIBE
MVYMFVHSNVLSWKTMISDFSKKEGTYFSTFSSFQLTLKYLIMSLCHILK